MNYQDGQLYSKQIIVNMPQMANSALSENWLFKEIGDIHWQLLCRGLNTDSAELSDADGDRLYATFISIEIDSKALFHYSENDVIHLLAKIERYGDNIYRTRISSDADITAKLVTSFTKRFKRDNTSLKKASPHTDQNDIPLIPYPDALDVHRQVRKGVMRTVESGGVIFELRDAILYETTHSIIPFYEINGVGLLYFAAYPIINEMCELRFHEEEMDIHDWAEAYHTKSRKILYLGNCPRTDKVIYRLHDRQEIDNDRIKLYSTLSRASDGKRIAEIFTVKERNQAH